MTDTTFFPLGDGIGHVQLIKRHEDVLLSVANSARISYNTTKESPPDANRKLAKFLWENDHTSPFRHQFYTIIIKAPLSVLRQWWKHQIGCPWSVVTADGEEVTLDLAQIRMDTDNGTSWNEISGRYVVLKPEFYIPRKFRSNAGHANKQASSELKDWTDEKHDHVRRDFTKACLDAYGHYQNLLDQGVAKEMARMLLPQNIYSGAVWSPSLQAILHFLSLRLKPDAQWEIRQYAEAIKALIQDDLSSLGIDL